MSVLGGATFFSPKLVEAYQEPSTPTGVLATVIYAEQINVRSGPSTVYYPIVGQLFPGDIVRHLGFHRAGNGYRFPSPTELVGWDGFTLRLFLYLGVNSGSLSRLPLQHRW